MPRFFPLAQAEELLPEVESAIRDAISLRSEYQQVRMSNPSVAASMCSAYLVKVV